MHFISITYRSSLASAVYVHSSTTYVANLSMIASWTVCMNRNEDIRLEEAFDAKLSM